MTLALALFAMALVGCMKTDPVSVREFVIEEARMAFPDAKLEVGSDTEVVLLFPSGNRQALDISAVQEGCKRVPRSCGSLVASLMIAVRDARDAYGQVLSLDNVVPSLAGTADIVGGVKTNQPDAMYVDTLAPGLTLRYGAIIGDSYSFADAKRLAALQVSSAALRSAALANLEPLATVHVRPFPGEAKVHQVFGRMSATGLLLKKNLDAVRNRLGCKELPVAFPRRGTALVADAGNAADVARLREIAGRFLQPAIAMISGEVYLIADRSVSVIPK